jgi:hypothetical protein
VARAILPAWKTYPGWALFRDAGLPTALIGLEEAKLRFALHLQTVDKNHPLTARIKIPVIPRGRGAGGLQKPQSKVHQLGMILPTITRHTLMAPHYSLGYRTDPKNGIAKNEAAKSFKSGGTPLLTRTSLSSLMDQNSALTANALSPMATPYTKPRLRLPQGRGHLIPNPMYLMPKQWVRGEVSSTLSD